MWRKPKKKEQNYSWEIYHFLSLFLCTKRTFTVMFFCQKKESKNAKKTWTRISKFSEKKKLMTLIYLLFYFFISFLHPKCSVINVQWTWNIIHSAKERKKEYIKWHITLHYITFFFVKYKHSLYSTIIPNFFLFLSVRFIFYPPQNSFFMFFSTNNMSWPIGVVGVFLVSWN